MIQQCIKVNHLGHYMRFMSSNSNNTRYSIGDPVMYVLKQEESSDIKKSNDESLKYGNSRNNIHKKIPVINLNKIQSSLDFIIMNRNKLKNINNKKFGNK